MRRLSGFTLVELLVALVVFAAVSAGIHRLLAGNRRLHQAQGQAIALRQSIRAGAAILPAELRELDATDGDIAAMGPAQISIRAPRQLALLCAAPVLGPGPADLIIRETPFHAVRDFDPATDSILVYYEGDPGTGADDGWVRGRVRTVAPRACPDGRPGRSLSATLAFAPLQLVQTGSIPDGAPLRGFAAVTYRLYQSSDQRWYLGYQEGVDPVQPLIGPLRADGVRFAYFDSAGGVATQPGRVAGIEVTLGAEAGTPPFARDEVTTWIALRNNRRF
jgi:prepilin-type N-terminal cleavage/methylation domain-containing protein